MAEFELTLSAMSNAATNIANYTQQFSEQAELVYQAAQTLSETWTGDASTTWLENMEQLRGWMNQLVEVLETYSAALNKARDDYETADTNAAKNFS